MSRLVPAARKNTGPLTVLRPPPLVGLKDAVWRRLGRILREERGA
jgi:hypothetical protein